MNFGQSIAVCFKKYGVFQGRARRSEYWWFQLFSAIVSCVPYLGWIAALGLIVPDLAVTWRRMHDLGRHGATALLQLIPIVGTIIVIIICSKDGQKEANQWGPSPKY